MGLFICALELRSHAGQASKPCKSQSADGAGPPMGSTQRAGIAPARFISGRAAFVGGVPLTRAMNPWAMPEAST
jgi:hypothetical protein